MEIKTADGGTKSVASQGLGVWGAVGGALGTLAFVNQLGVGANGAAAPFRGGYGVSPMTAQLAQIDALLLAENSMLKAEKYSDHGDARQWAKIAELDKEAALNKQRTEFLFSIVNDKIDCFKKEVECNYVKNSKYLNAKKIIGGVTGDGYTFNLPTVPTDPPVVPTATPAV